MIPLWTMAQTVHKGSRELYIQSLDWDGVGVDRIMKYNYYYDEYDREVYHGKFSVGGGQKTIAYAVFSFSASGSYNHGELNGPISISLAENGRSPYGYPHWQSYVINNSLSGSYDNGVPDKQWTFKLTTGSSKLNTTVVLDKGRLCKFKTNASGQYCEDCKNQKTSIDVSVDPDGYASGYFYYNDGDKGVLKSGVLTNFFIRRNGDYSPLDAEEKAVIAEIVAHNGKVDEFDLMERGYMLEEHSYTIDAFFSRWFDKAAICLSIFDGRLDRFPKSFKFKVLTKNFTNPFDQKKENVRTLVSACAGQGALGDMFDKTRRAEEAIQALRQEAESMHSQRLMAFCDENARQLANYRSAIAKRSVRELETQWSAERPDWTLLSNANTIVESWRKDLGGDDSSAMAKDLRQTEQRLLPYQAYYAVSHTDSRYGDADRLVSKALPVLGSESARFDFLYHLIGLGYGSWSKEKVSHYVDLSSQYAATNNDLMKLYFLLMHSAKDKNDYASVVEYADYLRVLSKSTPIDPKYGDAKDVDFQTQNALYQLNRQKEHLGNTMVVDRELIFMRHDSILTFNPTSHQIVPSSYSILTASDYKRVVVRPGQYAILPSGSIDQSMMNSVRWQNGEIQLGNLTVNSDPSGVQLFLDGVRQTSVTPCTIENLVPGSYEIYLFNPKDSASFTGQAVVASGKTVTADYRLLNHFNLHLNSNVKDGKVIVDGVRMGNLYDLRSIKRGPHTITVKAKDYEPLEQKVYVNSDRDLDFNLVMKPEYMTTFLSLDFYVGGNSFNSWGTTFGMIGKHCGPFVSASIGMGWMMNGYKVGGIGYFDSDNTPVVPSYTYEKTGSGMGSFVVGLGARLNTRFLVLAGLGYSNKYHYEVFRSETQEYNSNGDLYYPSEYFLDRNTQKKGLSTTLDVVWYGVDAPFALHAGVKTVGTTPLFHAGLSFCITD